MQQMCRVVLLCILLRMTYQDIRKHSVSILEAGLGFAILFGISCYDGHSILENIKSLLPGIAMLFLSFFSKEQIGYGDGIVFVLLGSVLSLEEIMCVLLLSLFLSMLYSIGCLLCKKCRKKVSFPFVPFITGAYLIRLVSTWS